MTDRQRLWLERLVILAAGIAIGWFLPELFMETPTL